ncbi:MAG: response regulator transcription factor [Alphaproteobacteria bacterium]|nr:response regulator transcription factor [Alphaproteobacteria bacterium]
MKKEALKQDFTDVPNVLVIDDDERIRDLVARYLNEHGYLALKAESAEEALEVMESFIFDILVVDVMMPGKSGVELTELLREKQNTVPVLLLTAMGEVEDRITGLSAGADDYLPKPFDPRELVLRLDAILKRVPKDKHEQVARVQIGRWMFDIDHPELVADDERVQLTNVEVNLLTVLCQTPGEVVSRDALSDKCDLDPNKRTIDVQVTRLRRKVEENSNHPRYLQTVRGQGYLLRAEILERR